MPEPQAYSDHLYAKGLDELTRQAAVLAARIEELEAARAEVLDRIRAYGRGKHVSATGKVITVRPPNRRFDADRAALLLPEEVRSKCVTFTWDAKMIKGLLTQDQLDQCYQDGTGQDRVVIE